MTLGTRRRGYGRGGALPFPWIVAWLAAWLLAVEARADEPAPRERGATFTWNESRTELYASFGYRDVVDSAIRRKLLRGLPTTIVLTGALHDARSKDALSTTAQTCKITWHVWNEAYRLEITRPDRAETRWTPTLEGVLRRCAEARDLLVATSGQVSPGKAVVLQATVQVNPVSEEVLTKIKHWVSRPLRTGTAAPGDALFSTFTGLFMRRLGEAERKLEFITPAATPSTRPVPSGAEKDRGRNEG
jgi:hypothetical protein